MFSLGQNYPNPFNPTTKINYSLPKAGNVKLTVYNAVGSMVATIVNEYKPAGSYSVQFNGTNFASGIYLYRLESGINSAAKKFILMK
jgi:flagellar hook assembly protein FlgD